METFEFTRAKIEADRAAATAARATARREAMAVAAVVVGLTLAVTGVAFWVGGQDWATTAASLCAAIAAGTWIVSKSVSVD